MESNKINQVLPYISTNNISKLNELIYAGVKLVCEKIGMPLMKHEEKIKTRRKIRLETQMKNLRKQAKMIKQRKDTGTCRNNNKKATQERITIQLEVINQNVLAKEGILKRYRQRVKQYRQNRTFKNNERKFYQQVARDDTITYQQLEAKETE